MQPVLRSLLIAAVCGASASAQTLTEAATAAAGGTVGGVAGKKVGEGVSAIFNKVDKQTGAAAEAAKGKDAPTSTKSNSKKALIEAGPGKPSNDGLTPVPQAAATPKPKAKAVATAAVAATAVVPTKDTQGGNAAPRSRWAWEVPPPPPPPERHATAQVAAKVAAAPPPPPPPAPPPAIEPLVPPPPPVSVEDLQKVAAGMTRSELLKFGEPRSRITMFQDGGLLEIFNYYADDPVYGSKPVATVRLTDGAVSSVQWRP